MVMEQTGVARPTDAAALAPSASTWLKLSVLYLTAGAALGIAMGATENFTLRSVHSHLSLLGWATGALAGLIYAAYPDAEASRLAKVHFWLHNTAVPAMMASLAWFLTGHPEIVPVLVASEFVVAGAVVAFACNVFANVKPGAASGARIRKA
jgi:hypothetical protein